jgi:hypothetical protein
MPSLATAELSALTAIADFMRSLIEYPTLWSEYASLIAHR